MNLALDIDVTAPEESSRTEKAGRYVLCGEIASGGMASIHLAVARGPGGFSKVLALKRVHPHLATQQQFVDMFLDEGRIASMIDHPNVCSVLDVGHDERSYYLVMEYLLGEPLRAVRKRLAPFRETQREAVYAIVARMVADACEGLHAAHETRDADGRPLDIVHRDVSPQNLYVTYEGSTKLVDFGIARAANRLHHTNTGTLKGKFSYMAPEQLKGGAVDRRADVWALGVVLWECLAGRALFRRDNQHDTILAVASGDVPRLRDVVPEIPSELDDVVRRALQHDPRERFPTARAMGAALRTWLAMHERPATTADVASWMHRIFPGELERKRQEMNRALVLARHHDSKPPEPMAAGGDASSPGSAADHQCNSAVFRKAQPTPEPIGASGQSGRKLALAAAFLVAGGLLVSSLWRPAPGDGREAEEPRSASAAAGPVNATRTGRGPRNEPRSSGRNAPQRVASGAEARPRNEAEAAKRDGREASAGAASAEPSRGTRSIPVEAPQASKSSETAETVEQTEARPRRTRSGQVQVAARGGWAQVYVGRRRLGPTPGRFTLPAGRHVLRFEHGQAVTRTVVRVQPGRVARVTVDLSP